MLWKVCGRSERGLKQYFWNIGKVILVGLLATYSGYADTISCKKVRFSDVGWTDITATTAVASVILKALGYEPKTTQLSVPVTYASLKNKDIDVFLGNWMPSMAADVAPYQKNGSVEVIGTVLTGARYTLAVPKYVYDAGVKSVSDLEKKRDAFEGKIFGIEPGNDGNRLIQKMIEEHAYGLGAWKLIESSEQAMLMQVIQAAKKKKWVVFLGWEPHPMNTRMKMVYLDGADQYFGSNQGSSKVHINTRRNYSKECPDVVRFLKSFTMTIESMNALMSMMLDEGIEPEAAAKKWLLSHPEKLKLWLNGVH
jgi:glycine betaine/proline transport system substrate-binding protein